jgi:hypothetical protein
MRDSVLVPLGIAPRACTILNKSSSSSSRRAGRLVITRAPLPSWNAAELRSLQHAGARAPLSDSSRGHDTCRSAPSVTACWRSECWYVPSGAKIAQWLCISSPASAACLCCLYLRLRRVYLSACLSVSLCVCLSACLPACPSVPLSVTRRAATKKERSFVQG